MTSTFGTSAVAVSDNVESLLAASAVTRSITPTHVYRSAVSGFAANLTVEQERALAADARVAAIVPDEQVILTDDGISDDAVVAPSAPPEAPAGRTPRPSPTTRPTPTPSFEPTPTPKPTGTPKPGLPTPGSDRQIIPTGVERIGRPSLDGAHFDGSNKKADIDIAMIDTGVAEHPDLNVAGGVDCTHSGIGWHDGNGHGTHVSGTAAAKDNDFGVVGVAPGARIWSVKVLNSHGRGRASWLLCGIDWVAAQRDGDKPLIEVANMSLEFHGRGDDHNCGLTENDAVHQAICRASGLGTIFVVAAGNDDRNAANYRPAAYDEVITVSALSDFDGRPGGKGFHWQSCPAGFSSDRDDVLASFSNYGRDIDIMAPGKCIWSTNKNGGYRAMSGTSMATPHVTGAVALYLLAHPNWTFQDVRQALIACGTYDWRVKSDHDKFHEPVLNLSRLC